MNTQVLSNNFRESYFAVVLKTPGTYKPCGWRVPVLVRLFEFASEELSGIHQPRKSDETIAEYRETAEIKGNSGCVGLQPSESISAAF